MKREILAFVVILGAFIACTPRTPAQAEAAYTAEQLRCVDLATTLAESKACRAKVDERWGVRR